VERPADWAALDPEQKRQRLLDAAAGAFIREGLDAPMPAVAEAAGIGVGSLYRRYRSKEDLIAAIVVRQMEAVRAEVERADRAEDAGEALERTVRHLVDRQATNKLLRAALAVTSDQRDVELAVGEVSLAWQRLLDRARQQGSIRRDATVADLRLVFAAAGAAGEVEDGGGDRILELLLEALRRSADGGG
jgi:AcrR family transcriptional regulator